MSDPFIDLNINNLQTISNQINKSNNRFQQQMSNQSMSKPLMSSHLPQLPQQQRSANLLLNQRSTVEQTTRAEEECDERKKFEKYRKFQLQQKRLQEMSFSRTSGQTNASVNSSADHLIANLIQRVETDAKLDKRITNNSHKQTTGVHVFNPSVAANNVPFGQIQTIANTSASYVTQYPNFGPNITHSMTSIQPMVLPTNDRQLLAEQQNKQYFNNQINPQTVGQQTCSQNQSLNPTPILQQIFNSKSGFAETSPNYAAMNMTTDGQKRLENCNNYSPQMTANQSMTSTTNDFNLNSEPIFSITSNNNLNVNSINTQSPQSTNSIVGPLAGRKLPVCFENMSQMPALYMKVWNYVRLNDMSIVCNTNKLYPVLLSVGLPQPVLAQLWSVVNQTIPGQLTCFELSMALALIALVQKNSVNPLEEIYKLNSLPVPNIEFFKHSIESKDKNHPIQTSTPQTLELSTELPINLTNVEKCEQNDWFSTTDPTFNEQNDKMSQNLETVSTEDTNNDDFDDFKSADFSSYSSGDSHSKNKDLILGQTLNETKTGSVTIDDDFDDFKSATISESNQSIDLNELRKNENELKSKTNTISDAMSANISAIFVTNSGTNSNTNLNIPSVNVTINCGSNQNQLDSGSDFAVNFESFPTTFDSNSGSVDKYSVFRGLSSTENHSTRADDFGDFLSHSNNCDAESVDSLQFGHQDSDCDNIESIGQQIIQICRQLIHKAFNVLVVNHGEDSVLEAIRANDGNRFALDLLEVYLVSKRVVKNLKLSDKLNEYLIKLIDDIESTWNTIQSVFTKASLHIEYNEEKANEVDVTNSSSHCAICCSKTSTDRPVLTFAGHEYHTSCANLWLNCINPTLPQLLVNCR